MSRLSSRGSLGRAMTVTGRESLLLKAGTVDALVAQYPHGIGQLGSKPAVKWAKGETEGYGYCASRKRC